MKENSTLKNTLLIGIAGAIIMAISDYLMIYGDPTFTGNLPWLTQGVRAIHPNHNKMAMFLAYPAVVCYAISLFSLHNLFPNKTHKRNYEFILLISLTPWLAVHLLYTMILYIFAHIEELSVALSLSEALFAHFSWIVFLSEVLMILPFLYTFVLFFRKKSALPRSFVFNNPIFYYIILKAVSTILPETAFTLAFVNALMSESMLIYFLVFLLKGTKYPLDIALSEPSTHVETIETDEKKGIKPVPKKKKKKRKK